MRQRYLTGHIITGVFSAMDVTCCVLLDTDGIEVKGDNDPNTRCSKMRDFDAR